jgi:hypothetical protein
MELGLKVIGGVPGEGRTLPLPLGRRLRLGRDGPEHGIDLQLPCTAISRLHCEVWRDQAGVWVMDHQSRGGTLVNGRWVPTQQRGLMLVCDRLEVGPAQLRLVCLGPLERAWLEHSGGAVCALARSIREEGWRQGGVLHDALLDAGCDDTELLDHCLVGCSHGTDCSLLDLLLGEGEQGPGR